MQFQISRAWDRYAHHAFYTVYASGEAGSVACLPSRTTARLFVRIAKKHGIRAARHAVAAIDCCNWRY